MPIFYLYFTHITSPVQWDEEIAQEFVAWTCNAMCGEYVSPSTLPYLQRKGILGKPLKPATISARLKSMRSFFADLQDVPHRVGEEQPQRIPIRFKPDIAFEVPRDIQRKIQPNPRDIEQVVWCKLAYAAATLTEEDIKKVFNNQLPLPLNYYKAVALLWVTSARRANEITRLRVGCIRRDWNLEMRDEDELPLEKEQVFAYLGVPHSKTKGFFWVPVPACTADAIETWEKERASQQDQQIDHKDNSLCDFLFMHRNTKMGLNFLNTAVIPLLCAKAGVPLKDARGTITSHRGRSTIATMLRQKGVSLEDIAQFLGHANTRTVRAYARTDPFQFAVNISKANDMMRIVEGLIDTRAARQRKPNVFFSLDRGADGKPRFCGNPAWTACPHRLACLKCDMYVGGGQAQRLAEREETRDEIIRFQTEVPMTEQEQAAACGDIERLNQLITQEQDVPPPEAPSDEFHFNKSYQPNETLPSIQKDNIVARQLALEERLAELKQELAEAEKHHNGRNVFVKSLKKQIADLTCTATAIPETE